MMERVDELCERVGEKGRRLEVLHLLCSIRQGRGEYRKMLNWPGGCGISPGKLDNPIYSTLAHAYLAIGWFHLCDFAAVRQYTEQAAVCYRSASSITPTGYRVGVAESMVVCAQIVETAALWTLGLSDRAMHLAHQSNGFTLKNRHMPGMGLVVSFQLILHHLRGERQSIHDCPN